MRARPRGPSGACLCCVSIAGTLICATGDSAAQPTTGAAAPNNEQPDQPVDTPNCSVWIDVHVVDASTHEPVAGASVSTNGKVIGFTNENGRLRVGPLCAGHVTVAAERGDYQARTRTIAIDRAARLNDGVGGAALEYRLFYFRRPEAGELTITRSGFIEVGNKTFLHGHWIFDQNGKPLASIAAIAVSFDLKARKALPMPPEMRAAYEEKVVPGFVV